MLINGFQYIISCQCRLSRTPIDQIIAEQYQNVSTIAKDCLKDNRILITDQWAKQAFSVLESIFKELQSRRISTRRRIRAQREYRVFNIFYVNDQILLYVEPVRTKSFILVKQLIFNVNQKNMCRKQTLMKK